MVVLGGPSRGQGGSILRKQNHVTVVSGDEGRKVSRMGMEEGMGRPVSRVVGPGAPHAKPEQVREYYRFITSVGPRHFAQVQDR